MPKKADVSLRIYPKVKRNASRSKENMSKPTPPADGRSLDGLYPVAAAAEDDDEISFVTSRRYAAVRVGGRHGRDT